MSQRLIIAQRAARAADKILLAKHRDARDIRHKGKRDTVTDADYAAERIIQQTLRARFPGDQFTSEEGNAREHKRILNPMHGAPTGWCAVPCQCPQSRPTVFETLPHDSCWCHARYCEFPRCWQSW